MVAFFANMLSALRMRPALAVAAFAAASAAALGAALVSQYGFGLAPCELCIYQRVPYGVVIGLGIFYAALRAPRLILSAMAGCFFIGGAIAAFHVGVEQKWWEGFTACTAKLNTDDLEALRAQIMNAPVVRCDEIAWSLFGISMAGYNVAASLFLGGFALYFAKRVSR